MGSTNELGVASNRTKSVFLYPGAEFHAMEGAQRYHEWILRYFDAYLGKRIMEIGAGIGNFARFLIESAPASEFFLFEPAANLFPIIAKRFASDSRVRVFNDSVNAEAASLAPDTVVMVNVLEHIEDDAGCLDRIYSLLPSGGHLLLFVPALPAIYGSLDQSFEHFRRYTKPELSAKIRAAGFHVLEQRYFNLVGVPAWFFFGRILKKRIVGAGSIRRFDRWFVPPLAWLESLWEPPVGQSLLAIARK
ncbi:MAG TPA: class I SAM-dependent methyltransferase [Verrucomicrobiae bacterium]|nr:class I SAM-dependent methyltransferase [Verrucomicrobiae bacterium]